MKQECLTRDPASGKVLLRHEPALLILLGRRPVIGQHTMAEEKALRRWASERRHAVEIGVAAGASAFVLKEALDASARLTLIDPYPSGRIPGINLTSFIAHRHVRSAKGARVRWIRDFSFRAIERWNEPIDFLFIDGDHRYDGCRSDFLDWRPFVVPGGIVAFHDARTFKGGWTSDDSGPVRVVNEFIRSRPEKEWEIVEEADSLVIAQKTGRSAPHP